MRKFQAAFVFDGKVLHRNAVLHCSEEGRILNLLPCEADPEAEALSGLLCPGFVNAHCHLELSHLQGRVPEGTGLVDFLIRVLRQREDAPERIREAMQKADADMRDQGIVAVGDISNRPDSVEIKKRSSLRYHTFVECLGLLPQQAPLQLDGSLEVLRQFRHEGLSASLVPHAPYSVSEPLFRLISEFEPSFLKSIHNQECAAEDQLFRQGSGDFLRLFEGLRLPEGSFVPSGTSSLQTYIRYLNPANRLLLVHNTFSSREDLDVAIDTLADAYFCLCPGANRYIESRLPDLKLLREVSSRLVLGTDSLASNRQLSILQELRLLQEGYPDLALSETLSWATLQGARALGMEDALGSFESGKTPGVLQLAPLARTSEPALGPDTRVRRLL